MTAKTDFQKKIKDVGGSHMASHSGVIELAGEVWDIKQSAPVTISDNITLTEADSGKIFFVTADAKVITLPATVAGVKYTFINKGADGAVAINVSPAAADAIHGTTNASTNVVLSGVDNKDAINTKGTATTGDYITIIGDGTEGWYVIGCGGIWASE